MNILRKINFVLVTVLGIAAGIPKIMRVPAELGFFQSVGLSDSWVVVFGSLQVVGGVLMIFPKTRMWGAALTAAMFLGSAVMLLVSGNMAFGLISLLPVAMADLVILDCFKKKAPASG